MLAKSLLVPSSVVAILIAIGCGATKPVAPPAAAAANAASAQPSEGAAPKDEAPEGEVPGSSTSEAAGGASACDSCEDEKCFSKCDGLCDKKDKDACSAVVNHYSALSHDLIGAEMDAKPGAAQDAARKKREAVNAKLLKYAKLGCDVGSGSACVEYGSLAWSGQAGEVSDKKYAISFDAYKKACDLGDMSGCDNLGRSYLAGEGTPKDAGKAADAWGRACLKQRYGCGELKKLVAAKNKQALAAYDVIKKECAKIGAKEIVRTACDAQKELEKK